MSHFGIWTVVFKLDDYPIKIFMPSNLKATSSIIANYTDLYAATITGLQAINRNQHGDIKKYTEYIINILKSKGMAIGQKMPK